MDSIAPIRSNVAAAAPRQTHTGLAGAADQRRRRSLLGHAGRPRGTGPTMGGRSIDLVAGRGSPGPVGRDRQLAAEPTVGTTAAMVRGAAVRVRGNGAWSRNPHLDANNNLPLFGTVSRAV